MEVIPSEQTQSKTLYDLVNEGDLASIKRIPNLNSLSCVELIFGLSQSVIQRRNDILLYLVDRLDPVSSYDHLKMVFEMSLLTCNFNLVQRLIPRLHQTDISRGCLQAISQYNGRFRQQDIINALILAYLRRDTGQTMLPNFLAAAIESHDSELVDDLLTDYFFPASVLMSCITLSLNQNNLTCFRSLVEAFSSAFPVNIEEQRDIWFQHAISLPSISKDIIVYLLSLGISPSVQEEGLSVAMTNENVSLVMILLEQRKEIPSSYRDALVFLAVKHTHVRLYNFLN